MYIVIKKDKARHIKEKLHMLKGVVESAMECFDESIEESHDMDGEYGRYARHDSRYGNSMSRMGYDDYEREESRRRSRY